MSPAGNIIIMIFCQGMSCDDQGCQVGGFPAELGNFLLWGAYSSLRMACAFSHGNKSILLNVYSCVLIWQNTTSLS